MTALESFVTAAGGPVLMLDRSGTASVAPLPDGHEYAAVALVVADRLELRATVAALPPLPEVTAVACVLTGDQRPLPITRARDWPRVTEMHARRLRAGGVLTVVRFAGPVAADSVLRRLATTAVPGGSVGPGPAATGTVDAVVAPDLSGGPLDEGVLNPIGFEQQAVFGLAELSADGPSGLRLHGVGTDELLDLNPARGATPPVVAALRGHLGVRVRWEGATPALARTVAGLAMAGVPLVNVGAPEPTIRAALGDDLQAALSFMTDAPDLTNPLRREEHSILLRRAALSTHSGPAWRARTARAAGRPGRRFPTCSVVLATRRPEQLDFALRQVRRQRAVDLEVVVVAHGFEADLERTRDVLDGVPHEVLSRPADALFGDVLTAGVAAASGDLVVKMDDDDWYGRDFLLDLLLAREYSGADLVGTTAEMVYLEQLDRTVRGRSISDASERFAKFIAGGSMCLPRDLLGALGGFRPVRRFVDHQLLRAALTAGATVYRGHGLGYLLRRRPEGHTWDAGAEFFLAEDRVAGQWQGFAPSRLLEVDAADRPDLTAQRAGPA